MSGDKKSMKPPTINLGTFKPPQGAETPQRPSFYSEESTMITSLSDLEKEKISRGDLSPSSLNRRDSTSPSLQPVASLQPAASFVPPPLQTDAPLSGPSYKHQEEVLPDINLEDAFEGTSKISPEDLKIMEEGGLFDVPSKSDEGSNQPVSPSLSPPLSVQEKSPPANVVAVFNARGGVGATTLAVNLAGAAQAFGQHVALIDLDLQLGAVTSMLDGKPLERSLAELLMEATESVDYSIKSAIDERCGINIIAQEGRIGEIGMVTPDRLPTFIGAVKAQHSFVIIDGLRSFSDHAVTALDSADVILLVITQDIPALRSAKHVLSLFKKLGYSSYKVRLVLNRHNNKSTLSVAEIEERLDHSVYETLENSFPFVSSLIEEGRLARDVNLKHKVTRGFDRLASRLLGIEVAETKGFFSSLFSRGRSS